jgi:menaquinone-specific isochorismate synthase
VDEVGGRRSYETAVSRALERIARGDFEKIVLARAKDVRALAPLHPLGILNGLRQRFPDCNAFSVANGRGQSFIGASPERLLRVDDGVVLTEALAGSTDRGATASEDASLGNRLLRSEKDLREQRIVLDSIVRSLAPLGLDLRYSARPLLRRLSNVQHLHTPVEATLPKGVRLLDMLGRLHPTPAVGGTPREIVVPLIAELEAFPRGLYGGAVGWIDSRGGGEFIVALRSALVEGSRARMYAGAGIVDGSSPQREFEETELKFRAMQDALLGT